MFFSSKFVALFAIVTAASVNAVSLQSRGAKTIFDPRIIIPDASTVWIAGTTVNVTW